MADMMLIPKADLVAGYDAIRAKGVPGLIKSEELAGKIDSIKTGKPENVKTVIIPYGETGIVSATPPAETAFSRIRVISRMPDHTPMEADKFSSVCGKLAGRIEFSKARYPGAGGTPLNSAGNVMCVISGNDATIYDRDGGGVTAPTDATYLFSPISANSIVLTGLNTHNTANFTEFLSYSRKLKTIDLRGVDTTNATILTSMLGECYAETLDLSSLNTESAVKMDSMFYKNRAKALDVSGFDVRKVEDFSIMFQNSSATSINTSGWVTSSAQNMAQMFSGCKASSLDLSTFDTRNVTTMELMFASCQTPELDLSSFVTTDKTSLYRMFSNCTTKRVKCRNQDEMDRYKSQGSPPPGLEFYL